MEDVSSIFIESIAVAVGFLGVIGSGEASEGKSPVEGE